tara:strand:+ start:57377 stop:58432 length:1056 start_codon:yes stop_codon:yes gene_type:complete
MQENNNLFSSRKFLKPYVIAEVGVNHDCNIDLAKLMIDQAAKGGASCVKFQAYKASTLASKNSPYYWDITKEKTKSQYELFSKFDKFTKKEFTLLAEYCKDKNIDFMLTAFDEIIAESINPLVNIHKIASADITNLNLLKKIASFKKPVIFSCGASTLNEIIKAKNILLNNGATKAIPLHCVLNYPTLEENAEISFIEALKKEFGNDIGYSDHTIPTKEHDAQILSVLLGAKVLEKHFTYDKTKPGNDHYHAFDIYDLSSFTKKLEKFRVLYGKSQDASSNIKNQKKAIKNARRSLHYSRNLSKGDIINEIDLIAKRPGDGISPMLLDSIIGQTLKKDVLEDFKVSKDDFN